MLEQLKSKTDFLWSGWDDNSLCVALGKVHGLLCSLCGWPTNSIYPDAAVVWRWSEFLKNKIGSENHNSNLLLTAIVFFRKTLQVWNGLLTDCSWPEGIISVLSFKLLSTWSVCRRYAVPWSKEGVPYKCDQGKNKQLTQVMHLAKSMAAWIGDLFVYLQWLEIFLSVWSHKLLFSKLRAKREVAVCWNSWHFQNRICEVNLAMWKHLASHFKWIKSDVFLEWHFKKQSWVLKVIIL